MKTLLALLLIAVVIALLFLAGSLIARSIVGARRERNCQKVEAEDKLRELKRSYARREISEQELEVGIQRVLEYHDRE